MFLLVMAGLISRFQAAAQPKDNSPITRYGLGDVYRGDFNQSGATGGLFGAWIDPYRVNPVNPASLPYLRSTSLEFGLFARANQFRRQDARQSVWSGNLDYLSLAFPLKSRINELMEPRVSDWDYSMGVQLSPYSLVGYDVEFTQFVAGVDTIRNIFRGEGGLSQAAWSGGVKYKDFSVGIQAGYLFGQISNSYQLDLQRAPATYSTRNFTDFNVRGFLWQTGVMYRLALDPPSKDAAVDRKRRWLNMGIYANSNTRFGTTTEQLIERVNIDYSSGGEPLARDTILRRQGETDRGRLPMRLGAGMTLHQGEIYQLGFNVEYRNWSTFELPVGALPNLSYRDVFRFSVGGEWTPEAYAFRNYLRRIRYRGGLFMEQDPRVIDGQQMNGIGIQAGLGFPILLPRQQVSFIDLALEAGRRGSDRVQQDNYIRIRLAATLNDNSWFFKRKFN